jgi:hypothetical protein
LSLVIQLSWLRGRRPPAETRGGAAYRLHARQPQDTGSNQAGILLISARLGEPVESVAPTCTMSDSRGSKAALPQLHSAGPVECAWPQWLEAGQAPGASRLTAEHPATHYDVVLVWVGSGQLSSPAPLNGRHTPNCSPLCCCIAAPFCSTLDPPPAWISGTVQSRRCNCPVGLYSFSLLATLIIFLLHVPAPSERPAWCGGPVHATLYSNIDMQALFSVFPAGFGKCDPLLVLSGITQGVTSRNFGHKT